MKNNHHLFYRAASSFRHGFTLVEMAVVLLIISAVVGGGFSIATRFAEERKFELTQNRLNAIEKALLDYRASYNRLPCPADGSLNPDETNYGEEALNPGRCTGGTPAANFTDAAHATKPGNPATNVVGGMVPINELGLPKEWAIDGWGNKFSYHVDARATEPSAFITYSISNSNCFNVIVDDTRTWAADNDRNYESFHAVYALLSHGKDGHGAFSIGGPRINSRSINSYQQQNADFSATGTATTYDNLFHNLSNTVDPDDSKNNFDDILRFKTRAQLRTAQDGPGIIFPDLVVSSLNSSTNEHGLNFYFRCGDAFELEAKEMSDINNKKVQRISFSGNNTFILGSMEQDYHFRIWSYDGTKTHMLPDSSFTPPIPSGSAYNSTWAEDGSYFIVSAFDYDLGTHPNIVAVFTKTGVNQFELIDGAVPNEDNSRGYPVFSGNEFWGVNISPDGNELIIMYANGSYPIEPMLYKRNPDNTFTLVPDAIPDMGEEEVNRPEWSPDGQYLFLYHWDQANKSWLFRKDGEHLYSMITAPTLPSGWVLEDAAFSPNNRLLALMEYGNEIRIYEMGTDGGYHELANQPVVGDGQNDSIAFSHDGKYLAVGKSRYGSGPVLSIYRVDGNQVTLLDAAAGEGPLEQPTGTIRWIEWRRSMPWEQ